MSRNNGVLQLDEAFLARLREVFSYDPASGVVNRTPEHPWYLRLIEQPTGYTDARGYRRVEFMNVDLKLHRLAWFFMTGAWPTHEIDHINGVKGDNRWTNLRQATRSENMQNQHRARSDSSTGLIGAYPRGKRFHGQCRTPDNPGGHLGSFATAEEAHAAYLKAKASGHIPTALAGTLREGTQSE